MAIKRPRLPKLAGRAAAAPLKPTSTSYSASGLATAPNPTSEVGSSQPIKFIELVPELVSTYTRLRTYNYMMNDAGVSVSMRAAKMPVLGADWYVEPSSDDPSDMLTAQFVEDNLFNGLGAPWLSTLGDILRMFEFGFSVMEKVYEQRVWAPNIPGANKKTYTMLKKLAPRPASTMVFDQDTYDNNGESAKLSQQAIQQGGKTNQVQFDPNKLLIFTFDKQDGDLTGKSLLRTAYPHWYYKQHFYKIDAIQKERHAIGVPRGKLGPGWNEQDRALLNQMLRNIRTNEEAFIIETPNIEVDFAEVHGQLVNVLESADHHNIMILMNVMAQFLALGVEGKGGGRATGGAQTDIFMKSLQYIAGYVCEVVNKHLIPEIVVYNFPTTNFPKLMVRNIGETRDLQALGSALANLLARGGLTTDLATENWIRRAFDMPLKRPEDAAIDPNAAKTVTLYDATGNPVKALPVGASDQGTADATVNGNNGRKGDVGGNGGGGNTPKPVNAP